MKFIPFYKDKKTVHQKKNAEPLKQKRRFVYAAEEPVVADEETVTQPYVEFDKNFSLWHQPRLVRGIFSVLCVSFIMIWVEVLYHREVVIVQTNASIINEVRRRSTALQNGVNVNDAINQNGIFPPALVAAFLAPFGGESNLVGIASDNVADFFWALNQGEHSKIVMINRYAYGSMTVPWLLVSFLMYMFYRRLQFAARKPHEIEIFGNSFRSIYVSTAVSVLLFSAFQVYFYYFAIGFMYSTDLETQVRITNKLKEGLDCSNTSNNLPDFTGFPTAIPGFPDLTPPSLPS